MNDTINRAGIDLIKKHEGLRLNAYVCPAGYITIGYGHRIGTLNATAHITVSEAEKFLMSDAKAAYDVAVRETSGINLNSNQLSAVASFIFNVGEKAFMASTMRRMLRARNVTGAARQFDKWVYAHVNGKPVVMPGLVKRRAAERSLFEA